YPARHSGWRASSSGGVLGHRRATDLGREVTGKASPARSACGPPPRLPSDCIRVTSAGPNGLARGTSTRPFRSSLYRVTPQPDARSETGAPRQAPEDLPSHATAARAEACGPDPETRASSRNGEVDDAEPRVRAVRVVRAAHAGVPALGSAPRARGHPRARGWDRREEVLVALARLGAADRALRRGRLPGRHPPPGLALRLLAVGLSGHQGARGRRPAGRDRARGRGGRRAHPPRPDPGPGRGLRQLPE